MDLSYSPEELAFRDEVRGWLAANLPKDIRDKVVGYQHLDRDDYIRWHKILAAKGWSVPHWPVEWGGTGWDVTRRYIFNEEFGLAGAPALPAFGPNMCASVLLRFGSPVALEHLSAAGELSSVITDALKDPRPRLIELLLPHASSVDAATREALWKAGAEKLPAQRKTLVRQLADLRKDAR